MIDRSQFQMRQRMMPEHLAGLDKLVPASLRGAHFAVVEVIDAVQVDAKRGENRKTGEVAYEPAVVLRFKEFENRIYWLNKAGVNILCDVFGDDEKGWIGKQIPIVVKEDVKNPGTGRREDALWVANADEWEGLFSEDETARATTTAVAKPGSDAARKAREAAERRAAAKA